MPEKKPKTFITRPQTHAEFFQSFRKTLHGLASQGAHWDDFHKLEEVYRRKTHTPGSFLGTSFREPLVIKRSDSLSYEVYLEWIDWFKPLEDGSYDRAAYPRATPQAATILKAKSYEATMVELVYNFKARKFELWFNIQQASATTRRHMDNYMTAVGFNARGSYTADLGFTLEDTVEVPIYRFDLGEYEDSFDTRNRYASQISMQMETAMHSWHKALARSVKRNTRHRTVTRWIEQARQFARLARRNMTLDLEEMYETQKANVDNTSPEMQNWVRAVEQTHDDEAYYDMILQQPRSEHKRMLKVFQELDA